MFSRVVIVDRYFITKETIGLGSALILSRLHFKMLHCSYFGEMPTSAALTLEKEQLSTWIRCALITSHIIAFDVIELPAEVLCQLITVWFISIGCIQTCMFSEGSCLNKYILCKLCSTWYECNLDVLHTSCYCHVTYGVTCVTSLLLTTPLPCPPWDSKEYIGCTL